QNNQYRYEADPGDFRHKGRFVDGIVNEYDGHYGESQDDKKIEPDLVHLALDGAAAAQRIENGRRHRRYHETEQYAQDRPSLRRLGDDKSPYARANCDRDVDADHERHKPA